MGCSVVGHPWVGNVDGALLVAPCWGARVPAALPAQSGHKAPQPSVTRAGKSS